MLMTATGKFDPPEKVKYKPLDSDQTRRFVDTARDQTDTLTEVTGRIFIEIGIRNDTYVHTRPDWVGESRHPETNEYSWYYRVPKYDYCIGGVGEVGKQNDDGANLHSKGEPCGACRSRSHKGKSWVTDAKAEEYDYHPKTVNSPRKQWFDQDESDLARKLNATLEANGQIPILHNAVNRRIQKIADEAGIDRRVTAHALRHTYGCRLARMNFNPGTICDFMGHEDISMAKWYAEVAGVRKRDVMREKFDSGVY